MTYREKEGKTVAKARKIEAMQRGLQAMTPEERKAVAAAIRATAAAGLGPWPVSNIVIARGRAVRKKQTDKRGDAKRRVLVGARLPRCIADRCSAAAAAADQSLYAWTRSAILAALDAAEDTDNYPKMGKPSVMYTQTGSNIVVDDEHTPMWD